MIDRHIIGPGNTRIEMHPDPDFIGPERLPLTCVVAFDDHGRCTSRPLTPEEKARDEARRAERLEKLLKRKAARKSALKADRQERRKKLNGQ